MAQSTIVVLNGTSRTGQHLITQALAKGHRVRAVVRSTSRFYKQTKKHDDLSAHEWSDFDDLTPLPAILDGSDVVYIALCPPVHALLNPTWLNIDAITSICTALHSTVAPGGRSGAKLVLLSAFPAQPNGPRHSAVAEAILGHQFADLRSAHSYLAKQRGWLDVVCLVPGAIVDSESSDDATAVAAIQLREGGEAPQPISYARLAAGMQLAAADPRWAGKCVLTVSTSKVPVPLNHFAELAQSMPAILTHLVLKPLAKTLAWMALGGGVGYVVGSRDGGAWALRTLGVNVRAPR